MGRLKELDSLRGLAALTVVIDHLFLTLPLFGGSEGGVIVHGHRWLFGLFTRTPLTLIWAGNQAVILFFVLSGYVLALQFYGNKRPKYGSFLIRRVCRIYIPYVFALVIALTLYRYLARGGIASLSVWFNRGWTVKVSWGLIMNHLIMIGRSFNTDALDSPIWSLIHEMRISIIFPFLMIMILRLNWKISLGVGAIFSLLAVILESHFHAMYQPIYKTLAYVLMFIVGALLAKHQQYLTAIVLKRNRLLRIFIFILGVMLYVSFSWAYQNHFLLKLKSLDDLETVLGAAVLIVFAVSSKAFSGFLNIGAIRYLGKISYSLYLLHVLVLYTVMYTLYGLLPMWALWMITVTISLVLAGLSYRYIERPSIQLGRYLTRRRPMQLEGRVSAN